MCDQDEQEQLHMFWDKSSQNMVDYTTKKHLEHHCGKMRQIHLHNYQIIDKMVQKYWQRHLWESAETGMIMDSWSKTEYQIQLSNTILQRRPCYQVIQIYPATKWVRI